MANPNFDIWRLQSNADVRGLIEAVKQGTPDVRKRAITALRALGATSAIPALQAILVEEKDTDIRAVLIATLDYLFQQEVDEDDDKAAEQQSRLVQLIAQLNSDKPEQIIRAAQNLGELNEKIAVESLIVVFHNRKLPADVRLAAAEALLKLESAPVEISLLGALRHRDWHHRRNAAAVLGQLAADWAVRPLADALRDEQEIVRKTAHAALKRIGTPAALKAIEPPEVKPSLPPVIVETQTPPSPPSVTPVPTSALEYPPVDPAADTLPSRTAAMSVLTELPPVEPSSVSPAPQAIQEAAPRPVQAITESATPEALASSLEAGAPVDDEDTQPSSPAALSDDVS